MIDEIRLLSVAVLFGLLAACSTTQVTPVGDRDPSGQVDVYFSQPPRPFTVIGVVSAKRYKPGFTDPTVSDAIPQLRRAGAEVGADAVIVRSSRVLNDRHIVVEAEAIRYTDRR